MVKESYRMPYLISVIVPALNEADCIAALVFSIPVAEFRARGFETEILVVDNGSEDGTAELARRAGARVVCEPRRGYGFAYQLGFKEARGDVICTLDADGTYPAAALPEMVDRLWGGGLDFINAERFSFMMNGVMSRTRRLGNAVLTGVSQVLFRLPFSDSQSGMWVFRRELLGRMQLRAEGMAFSEEIKVEAAWRAGARCAELPIHYGYRNGNSKLHMWRDGFGNLLYLLRKRLT
jgi:glycosyltransferase involved in cell wall biosynthesis